MLQPGQHFGDGRVPQAMISLFGSHVLRRPPMRRRLQLTSTALLVAAKLSFVTALHAQSETAASTAPTATAATSTTNATSASSATSEAAAPTLCVILDNQSSQVSDAAFLTAIGERFASTPASKCDGASPANRQVSVVYTPLNRELTVTFSDAAHGAITRILQAPENVTEAADIAALVALELSRREPPADVTSGASATQAAAAPSSIEPEIASSALAVSSPQAAAPSGEAASVPPRPRRFATAAFFYPLAVNYGEPDVLTSLDFNLIYGVVGEVEGLQLGTFNDVRGPVQGLQLGLLVNGAGESLRGASIAGVMSSVGHVNAGLQAAGLLTLSSGTTDGIQAALLGNLSCGSLRGAQFSGVMNLSGGESKGLQISFGTNIAKHLRGAQFSLLGNYAENVTGMQVGLINIGNRVRGAQIGLINIAKEVEGVPIGLISVSKSGGVHLNAWSSNTNLANLGLRLGTRHTYSMFTLGYGREQGKDLVGPGFIFGVRVPVVEKFAIDLDVGGDYLLGTRLCCFESNMKERRAHLLDRSHFRLRAIPTWQPHPQFSVFAGAGLAVKVPFAVYSNFKEVDRAVTLGPEVLLGVSI